MINLKQFYDADQAAGAAVQRVAGEINALFEAGETEKALALRPQLDDLKAKAKEASQLYISMREAASGDGDPAKKFVPMGGDKEEPKDVKDLRGSPEYLKAFMDALRNGISLKDVRTGKASPEKFGILLNAISETGGSPAGSEGGFGAPIEFDNKLIERMRQFKDLGDGKSPYSVNVEDVNTNSGWRMIETAAAALPFTKLTELETLGDDDEGESPTFEKIDYSLDDYGDFLRLSDDALMDSTANLAAYVAKFFGRKAVLTNNSLILALINAISSTHVADPADLLTAIKTALNVTLDPDVAASAVILCNQTGFDLLDKLEDDYGRPLLQPDPTNVTLLRVKGREVVVLANRLWGDLTDPTPDHTRIAIGSPREYATLFRRMPFLFETTNVGGSAWRSHSSEVRGIVRLDAEEVDDGAMALLAVNVTSGS